MMRVNDEPDEQQRKNKIDLAEIMANMRKESSLKGGLNNPGDIFSQLQAKGYHNVEFDCKVHGTINENQIVLFRDLDGVETYHCARCYIQWIRNNVSSLEPYCFGIMKIDEAIKI